MTKKRKTLELAWGNSSSVGSKNSQAVGKKWVPCNVNAKTGVRMEDGMMVHMLSDHALMFGVADGHGSMSFFAEGWPPDPTPTVWFGGYECALIALRSLRDYLKEVHESQMPLERISPDGAAKLLRDAFAFAQCVLEMRMIAGSQDLTMDRRYDEILRLADQYFRPLEESYLKQMRQCFRGSGIELEKGVRLLCKSKVLQCHPERPNDRVPVVMHRKTLEVQGPLMDFPAEYGTTMTAGMIVRHPDPQRHHGTELHLAHAGDSDAFLLRLCHASPGQTAHGIYLPYRLTDLHSCLNPDETRRLQQGGLEVVGQQPVFTLRQGPFAEIYHIMPSRALGHSMLRGHGVTWVPQILSVRLQKGDVILIASDGLWSELSGRRPPDPEVIRCAQREGIPHLLTEDLSALTAAEILTSLLIDISSSSLTLDDHEAHHICDETLNQFCTILLTTTSPIDNTEILCLGLPN